MLRGGLLDRPASGVLNHAMLTNRTPARRVSRNNTGRDYLPTSVDIHWISRLTDVNQHTQSVIVLAMAMGADDDVRTLKEIDIRNQAVGYMPRELGAKRDAIRERLLADAKEKLDAATYRRLHMAF